MSRIVWFRQNYLPAPLIRATQQGRPDFDAETYFKTLGLCYANGFWPRSPQVTTPFRKNLDVFAVDIPAFDADFDLTFQDITDRRCQWLRQHRWDRPWLLEWSGGLDSTVMVCAVLKTFAPRDLENVTIGLTRSSVYENPQFYDTVIKPKFQTLDISSKIYRDIYRTHYLVNGEPADMLPGGGLAEHAGRSGLDLSLDWRQHSALLIEFLSSTRLGVPGAQWLYNTMQQDLDNLAAPFPPVTRMVEWFWWINFSWKWMSLTVHKLHPGIQEAKSYLDSLINWFDCPEYQKWSMCRGRYNLLRDNDSALSYKHDWRSYIANVWADGYYKKFKIKTASTSLSLHQKAPWACMLDDYSFLTAADDMEQILSLWPSVINT